MDEFISLGVGKNVKNRIFYVFFQYLIRAESYLDYEKLESLIREHQTLSMHWCIESSMSTSKLRRNRSPNPRF